MDTAIDPTELNRLKWRCKRGLLENDLFIERFFQEQGSALTTRHVAGLQLLMDLSDNDLLDPCWRAANPTARSPPQKSTKYWR